MRGTIRTNLTVLQGGIYYYFLWKFFGINIYSHRHLFALESVSVRVVQLRSNLD
jgi:hypothetical protein